MVDVRITIVGSGPEKEKDRPLHRVGKGYAITHKRRKWPIDASLILDVRTAKPFPEDVVSRLATARERQELLSQAKVNGSKLASVKAPPKKSNPVTVAGAQPSRTSPVPSTIPVKYPSGTDFDESQKKVIAAAAESRVLVDAGPGTGKTAVACARVAWLAGKLGISPSKIWLISFTRTAVAEIRKRVALLIEREIANAVQMGTIDSMAWQLNSQSERIKSRSFDENIQTLMNSLSESVEIQEQLAELSHVLIDEAQDIVGVRADLILELLRRIPKKCGVTIFSDEAQAIYGFASRDTSVVQRKKAPEPCLPDLVRRDPGLKFQQDSLGRIHRTSDPNLTEIFGNVRRRVLDKQGDAKARNTEVREKLRKLAHEEAPQKIVDAVAGLPDETFVLFRTRIEAISASGALRRAGIAHRLRMSKLPVTIAPWIAAALGQTTEARVGEKTFSQLWTANVSGTPLETITTDAAFARLKSLAPDSTGRSIDLQLLRRKLAAKPPSDLSQAELGTSGPLIGTIHASKGREAACVTLVLPLPPEGKAEDAAIDEETRVIFVGATRARQHLRIAQGGRVNHASLGSERVYRFSKWNDNPKCDLEVGLIGDLSAAGFAGRTNFEDSATVISNQKRWMELSDSLAPLEAYIRKIGDHWRFGLCTEYGASYLAVFDGQLSDDLWEVAKEGVGYFKMSGSALTPKKLSPIFAFGMTTIAVPSDSPEAEILHEPWRTSGLVLAPQLYGIPRFTVKSK